MGLTAGDLDARVDEVRAKLDELDGKRAHPRLGLDDADFNAKVDRAEARLDALNAKSARPGLGASGGGGGEGGGGGGGEGGLLGGLTMGLGALMPGMGGAVTGLGLLGATGAMALGPVGKALSEAHQAALNVGLTPQQLAATRFSNTVQQQQAQQQATLAQQQAAQDAITSASQIASAQEQLGMAHEQAAQDAVQAAEQIETSQMNLASVERSAAESQIQALHSVQQAQQGVEESNYGLSEAQYNLNQAWEAAQEQIRQLNDQLADSKLNVSQAELAVKQAEYQQRLINQNAYSTSLDRQQAALAVLKAQQQVKDSQDQLTAAQYHANLVNKQGVEGNQQVIQAKQGLVQAQYGVTNAAFAAADASRQLTLTELNNATQLKESRIQVAAAERNAAFQRVRDAEQIRQAQRQLSMAQEQGAYTQMRDAEQVAIAQRNVANTIKEQKLQWASMMSTENQAANQFMKDMSRLSPAGRDFVRQVLGMSDGFRQLEFAAQSATLPGFTDFLRGIQALLPTIQSGITQMGQAISHAFSAMGQLMQTPEFATMLNGLITNGIRFADIVLPAFAKFALELGIIGGQKGAVDGVANLLAGVARMLTGMAASLGQYTPQINEFLTAAGNVIAAIGPPLGQIIGLIAKTLEPLTSYLNAHPDGTIVTLLGQIIASMILFKPLVKMVSAPFRALSSAVSSIAGLPATLKKIVAKIVAAWSGLTGMETGTTAASGALGAGAAAGAARGAAGARGLTMLSAGEAQALGITSAGATLGETSAVTAGAGGAGVWAALANPVGAALALAAGGAVLGYAINKWADDLQKRSDAAAGVVHKNSYEVVAAATDNGTVTSQAFQDLANSYRRSGGHISQSVDKATSAIVADAGGYVGTFDDSNKKIKDVMYLGRTQFGQEVGLFVNSMGGNVQQLGQSLKAQGKTLNQAYTDSMAAAFQDLGGKTKASWAQVQQNMATGLDKYYESMRTTTTRDYDSLQQITAQLIQDGYNHRSDLEKQDSQKLQQVVGQYMTDSNNHLIDTSKSNISRLSTDMAKFFMDMKDHNSAALAADIKQLGKDTEGNIGKMYDNVDAYQSKRFDQEIAKAQTDIAQASSKIASGILGGLPGHAEGGLISGPGTGTSDSIIARVSAGEFVVNSRSTAENLPLLEAINARFATGGYVDPAAPRAIADQHYLVNMMALKGAVQAQSAGSVGGTIPTGQHRQIIDAALKAAGVPPPGTPGAWEAGLNTLIGRESGWNPRAINLSDSNAAAGDPSRGLAQTIMSTFLANHVAGTSMNIYDPVANVAAAVRYITRTYGSIGNVQQANANMPPKGYDSGGWLMPGDIPVNRLRKPEAVLTPGQWDTLNVIAQRAVQERAAGESGAKQVTIQFVGTQHPTAEQMAAIKREMGLALSGV
ncbi:transglycosylase SLT domain-containing protein [Streptomyces mirabilis]|uniref:transglycosylase SLT domain-containing protein n=1 Tax=Streptomyces mirabilis TaxID=68239 RepID=UPI00363B85B3